VFTVHPTRIAPTTPTGKQGRKREREREREKDRNNSKQQSKNTK
jgi:hypothetical protein